MQFYNNNCSRNKIQNYYSKSNKNSKNYTSYYRNNKVIKNKTNYRFKHWNQEKNYGYRLMNIKFNIKLNKEITRIFRCMMEEILNKVF